MLYPKGTKCKLFATQVPQRPISVAIHILPLIRRFLSISAHARKDLRVVNDTCSTWTRSAKELGLLEMVLKSR